MANSRMELRVDQADKQLIERGAALSGFNSMSEFVLVTMKAESEKAIKAALDTSVDAARFDRFLDACENASAPNNKLAKAFKSAKDKGFE